MWSVINKLSGFNLDNNEPSDSDFVSYFQELDQPQNKEYFDDAYEAEAIEFLKKYDATYCTITNENIELELINSNFQTRKSKVPLFFWKTKKPLV